MPDNELTLRLPRSNKARWLILATALNLVLFAVGIYTWVTTASLHLPLSLVLPAAGTMLPLANLAGFVHALSRRGIGAHNTLASRRSNVANSMTVSPLRAALPIVILLLADTVLLTISGTHLATGGEGGVVGTCEQQQRWQALFRAHDGGAIKHIQDVLQCCGFRNKNDMAFPFPAKGAPATCTQLTGRGQGCALPWAQAERTSAALLVALSGILGLAKVVSLVMLQQAAERAQKRRDMEDEAAAAAAERNASTNGEGGGRLVEEVESELGDDDDDGGAGHHSRHRQRVRHLDASERTPLIHDSPWAETGGGGQESQSSLQQSRQQLQHGGSLLAGDN